MKKVLFFLVFSSFLYSVENFKPFKHIEVNATVKDMQLYENTLLIATDNGFIKVYDIKNNIFIERIDFPKITDFMGDKVSPRVFSVDRLGHKTLALSESGKGGYANLWIDEDKQRKQVLFAKDKISAIKVRFIDEHTILLGLLSNEAVLFDIKNHKEVFRVQLNPSKFSDFALNEDKSQAVFSCESGVLSVIDTHTGKMIKELKSINRDNVYKVDFKKNIIAGAGQDRRGAIYNLHLGLDDFIEGKFLIYATGLSPSSLLVAFAMDEENNISIYDRQSHAKIAELKGQKSTLNTIIFIDEKTLFSSSDDSTIMRWNIK